MAWAAAVHLLEAERSGLDSRSAGREPFRRVRLYRT